MKYVIEIVDSLLISGDGVTAALKTGRAAYVYSVLGADAHRRSRKLSILLAGKDDADVSKQVATWFEAGCPEPSKVDHAVDLRGRS